MPHPTNLRLAIEAALQHEVQALHAGLSRRDWHSTEKAANQLRNRLEQAINEENVQEAKMRLHKESYGKAGYP